MVGSFLINVSRGMSAHASGRERARGWHTVAHQWRLPEATLPSVLLAVTSFRSWRSKNLT